MRNHVLLVRRTRTLCNTSRSITMAGKKSKDSETKTRAGAGAGAGQDRRPTRGQPAHDCA